jgi:hypothetical protein
MTNLPYQGLPSWPAYLESAMLRYHFVMAEFDQVTLPVVRLHRSIYGTLR